MDLIPLIIKCIVKNGLFLSVKISYIRVICVL